LGFGLELLSSSGGKLASELLPLARDSGSGPPPASGEFVLGRFAFDLKAFARALSFLRDKLTVSGTGGCPEILGLDEIGRLELDRKAGLWPCLELALAAASRKDGPRLLCCAAREGESSDRLRDLVSSAGLDVALFGVADLALALQRGEDFILSHGQ
jgi:hypothetical protein